MTTKDMDFYSINAIIKDFVVKSSYEGKVIDDLSLVEFIDYIQIEGSLNNP